ncbi:M23 family metallopeptidase [Kistimonas asteriae]|uniref:M23 family metallopeptidase n=1 Tax=Kistimonas asteriae TaxID=517724 RepID=UPI001BA80392|nr:M23 family metallopeptidase [Kistimonas asteriae]
MARLRWRCLFWLFSLSTSASAAETPSFIFPVDCNYGVDCFIQNYVDNDPTPAYRDYQCHHQTYNGHTGTDIRLINLPQMASGVAVLAAADGEVIAIRNSVADVYLDPEKHAQLEAIGLGNAVILQHSDSWLTLYGHLKKDSLKVSKGDWVQQGQVLGDIGLSGLTAFPHVHFQVKHQDQTIDPFTGTSISANCGNTENTLWHPSLLKQLTYFEGSLLDHGFSDQRPPDYQAIESGTFNQGADKHSPHLFFWVRLIGLSEGDQITLQLIAPDGQSLKNHTFPALTRSKAQQFYYIGMKNPVGQPGSWQGQLTLERSGLPVMEKTFSYIVEDAAGR